MGFVLRESFWSTENNAPILDLNYGYLAKGECNEYVERASNWIDLCDANKGFEGKVGGKDTSGLLRIFRADAERTFVNEEFRVEMVTLLQKLGGEIGDYHQGMGYIVSFLCLVVSTDDAHKIVLRLTDEEYSQGYFRGVPETFARDAQVFQRLLNNRIPEVGKHLSSSGVVPEAYLSKWVIGLCVHVLPFRCLFEYFEQFLKHGWLFLFKFGIALVETLGTQLLEAKRDVSKMFSYLRLDKSLFPDELKETKEKNTFFDQVLQKAQTIELEKSEIEEMRKEEWKILQERLERVRQREKELDEEDDESDYESEDEDDDDDDGSGDEDEKKK